VSLEQTAALVALWRGLLYDDASLDAALGLVPRLSFVEHLAFHEEAQRNGLRGKLRRTAISAMALEMVQIARQGLQNLDPDDIPLLAPLEERARSGRSPAEDVLEAFREEKSPARFLSRFALIRD
jgi:glutamate--cysteine ligase